MTRRTAILLSICLLAAIMLMAGAKPVQPPPTLGKTTTATANNPSSDKDWKTAQLWLESIGYDVTMDQMKTMKHLVLQKYSRETTPLINDKTMRNVRLLTSLESISIPRQIGDEGLKYIAGLHQLRSVNMPDCKITDNGLQYLGKLTKLKSLVLVNFRVHDAGLNHIKHLRLTLINLNRSKITDQGVAMLDNMPLQKLFLVGVPVTDACIPNLLKHKKTLVRLDVHGTSITPEGLARLKAELPNATIH